MDEQKWFARKIYEEDQTGKALEHFIESDKDKWENPLRWTSAKSIAKAKSNLRAKIKDSLGYTWKQVQHVDFEFGPTVKSEFFETDGKPITPAEKKYWSTKIWSTEKDSVNILYTNNGDNWFFTATAEESLFTTAVPIMDCNIKKFIESYKHSSVNWGLTDDQNFILCVFAFKENAEALGKIMHRNVVRVHIDKSLWNAKL